MEQKKLLKKVLLRIVQMFIISILLSGWSISFVSGGKMNLNITYDNLIKVFT